MQRLANANMETLMQVLALIALLLYLAPSTFGFAAKNRNLMYGAAAAALAIGLAVALIASLRWFWR